MTEEETYNSYYKACKICPRECNVDRTKEAGFCGEGAKIRIACAGLHFGEEPAITGRGGSGAIFFSGCSLKCPFCQNYELNRGAPYNKTFSSKDSLPSPKTLPSTSIGRAINKEEFVAICRTLEKEGATNINLITPSHLVPLLVTYLEEARKTGITLPFCYNTSGFDKVEMLTLLAPYVSIWLPDLKTLSPSLSKTLFNAPSYPTIATAAIKWMIEHFPIKMQEDVLVRGVIIRHLYLPGTFQESADVLKWLKENADNRAYISVMNQYTPPNCPKLKQELTERKRGFENRLVTKEEDEDLQDLCTVYDFDTLFYQELSGESSWTPSFMNTNTFPSSLYRSVFHWKTGLIKGKF